MWSQLRLLSGALRGCLVRRLNQPAGRVVLVNTSSLGTHPLPHSTSVRPLVWPAVALEFRRNTTSKLSRADFAWTVQHVMGIKLRPELVGVELAPPLLPLLLMGS